MLRRLSWMCAISVAFAAGFLAVLWADGDASRRSLALAQMDPPHATSTHYRAIRVASSSAYKRTMIAILDSAPTSRAQMAERAPEPRSLPVARTHTQLVAFAASPFPYGGSNPRTKRPFLNHKDGSRLGRKTHSGRVYWQDETYSDRRVLLHIPEGFDAEKPSVMVLFFHGHGATLERDVAARQQVPKQITESGINAVLVAPQFAVNARDSSAGNFWKPGGVKRFLDEVAGNLSQLHGDPRTKEKFANMPVVIVGYSGGYVPTAWALKSKALEKRLRGTVLLDGLYGEVDKFESWINRSKNAFFLSAYTSSTKRGNTELKKRLRAREVAYRTAVEGALKPGSVTFVSAAEKHRHYVTRAWTEYPISDVLLRMTDTARRVEVLQSAALD